MASGRRLGLGAAKAEQKTVTTKELLRQLPRTLALVWSADRFSAVMLAILSLIQAVVPAALAWVGKLIIDSVVAAAQAPSAEAQRQVLQYVAWELGLAVTALALGRGQAFVREVLRVSLGNLITERILEKSLTLELSHFEDSKTYDIMQNARRESASRPLSLAMAGVTVVKNFITLGSFGALLWNVSWWAVLVLAAAAVPSFFAETKLSSMAFKLYSWRAPEGRRLNYLEWILTRDAHVKEVKLFDLGPLILGRYRALYRTFLGEDRALARKRLVLGTALGMLSAAAFYACYVVVAGRAARAEISVGDLTLSLAVFRQGQAAFESVLSSIAGMYEDALFMSNLFLFLELPSAGEATRAVPAKTLPRGQHAIVLKHVSFRYPGAETWALRDISLVIAAGEKLALVGENGAGKSTLIKLLLRLYEPTEGEILYGGIDIRDLDVKDLRLRFGAVFQDFVRYQLSVGENIGLGEPAKLDSKEAIAAAAEAGGAAGMIDALPAKYDTVLGAWFENAHDLSGGQWQKLAVARAFMRDADVLVLDEPTAAIDAESEVALFERFRTLAKSRSAVIISHRFSTVRMADRIAVIEGGKLTEAGTHDSLVAQGGRYAKLFALQAQGYR